MQSILCTAVIPLAALAQPRTPSISEEVLASHARRVLEAFDVPGLAVAIVREGEPALVRGYGFRRFGEGGRVDGDTVFGIGSNTKAFTAVALGLLVEEGRLRWQDRVAEHLPAFRLHDPDATATVTIVDLLAHRTGLGSGAGNMLMFPPTTYTRDEIVARMRFIAPNEGFRDSFGYANLNYVAAGAVLERISGQSWETFITKRIFASLGMTRSGMRLRDLPPDGNVAAPHARGDAGVHRIEWADMSRAAPAGGIHSTAEDMARWVAVLLGRGSMPVDGREIRLYGNAVAEEIVAPHAVFMPGRSTQFGDARDRPARSYGLGWITGRLRGEPMVLHDGAMPGMTSRVTLLPDRQLGIVVLTNQESTAAPVALTNAILDAYLPDQKVDWIARSAVLERGDAKRAVKREAEMLRPVEALRKAAGPLSDYAGRYVDETYGEAVVTLQGKSLEIALKPTPVFRAGLEHRDGDTFIARWNDRVWRNDAVVTFHRDPSTREVTRFSLESASPPDTVAGLPLEDLDFRRTGLARPRCQSRDCTAR